MAATAAADQYGGGGNAGESGGGNAGDNAAGEASGGGNGSGGGGSLPFTGYPLTTLVLVVGGLVAAGLVIRLGTSAGRRANAS
jgi:hypothetical protein